MDFDKLQELVSSGTLGRGDLVRRDNEDVWKAASKCLELRATFRKLEPAANYQPTHNETALPTQPETNSAACMAREDHASEEDTPSQVIASNRLSDPTRPCQRWIAWSATAALMLVLFFADRQIASATPKFPQPRQVREQLVGLHWFLGTGPWSVWECWLLWADVLVILSLASGWLTRKLTR